MRVFELGGCFIPTGGHDTRAVAGLEHLCTGIVECVISPGRTGVGDESQRESSPGNRRTEQSAVTKLALPRSSQRNVFISFTFCTLGTAAAASASGAGLSGFFLPMRSMRPSNELLSEASAGSRSAFTRIRPALSPHYRADTLQAVAVGYMVCTPKILVITAFVSGILCSASHSSSISRPLAVTAGAICEGGAQAGAGMGSYQKFGPLACEVCDCEVSISPGRPN